MATWKKIESGCRKRRNGLGWTNGTLRYRKRVRCRRTGRKIAVVVKA